ncbi:MAG: SGNH/GDSL hydrolase family protein [Pseudomonadota bacterium]
MSFWIRRRGLLRIVFGPLLLWQGRRVRRDVLRLPEADGPRDGSVGQGSPLAVLIVGDSSAAGVGADHQDRALSGQLAARLAERRAITWRLIAQTGWTTAEALAALPEPDGSRFDLAVISLGVNDVTTEVRIPDQRRDYGRLIDRLKRDYGVSTVIASGLPPIGQFPALPQPLRWYLGLQGQAFDQALSAFAETRDDLHHFPLILDLGVDAMAEDGFHPGPEVYAAWADLLAAFIEPLDLPAATGEPA